ncbi:MAG: hypothetical protein J6Z16_01790, partial [Candidatus Methanomethylophilaceae archaeon]|nr:hypothetical protein [Candidatus Methanomethylophilaceae archaeon]
MVGREDSFEITDHGMKAGFHDPRFVVPLVMEVVREAQGLSYDQVASAFEYESDGRTIKGLDTVVEFGSDHTLDSLFLLRLPCEDGVREVYLNIEGQANRNVPYNLRDRAAIYIHGMMSRQKGAVRGYIGIRRMYSVWVMIWPLRSRANTWGRIPDAGLFGVQNEDEDAVFAVGPAETVFIFLGRADQPAGSRFFRLMNLRFGLGLSAEERTNALYGEFDIKLDRLSIEGMKSMNTWQEAIEVEREQSLKEGMEKGMEEGIEKGMEKGMKKGMEEGMEKGMEIGAGLEHKAAAEAIAGMVRGFMA